MWDLISALGELITSWRFYLCAIPGIALAAGVGINFDNGLLAWLIEILSVLIGVGGGLYWEWKAP